MSGGCIEFWGAQINSIQLCNSQCYVMQRNAV